MTIQLNGDTGITTPMYNGTISANAVTPSVSMKNRIINGAMVIDQRNAGASVTPTTSAYTLDRWQAVISASSKISVQQSSTAPAGFNSSLKVTSLAATTVGSTDYYEIDQIIEGYNVADLNWGTANAKTVTLSFWVQSSLTGTFGGGLANAGGRSYPFSYTISAANTWQQISITIAGDTTGTWNTTNGYGMYVRFSLGMGSTYSGTAGAWVAGNYDSVTGAVNVVGTNGATFYITGVQLEVGSSATSFDYRQYGQELALCQRYYEFNRTNFHVFPRSTSNNQGRASTVFVVPKRTTPTMTLTWANVGGSQGTEAVYPEGFGFFDNSTVPNYLYGNGATPYSWKAEAEL